MTVSFTQEPVVVGPNPSVSVVRPSGGPLPAGWMETRCWRSTSTTTAKSSPTGELRLQPGNHVVYDQQDFDNEQLVVVVGLPVTGSDQLTMTHSMCFPAKAA